MDVTYNLYNSGGSRPSDNGGGEGAHPDPEIRGAGAVSKIFFSALRASVWPKKRGARAVSSPGSATVQRRYLYQYWLTIFWGIACSLDIPLINGYECYDSQMAAETFVYSLSPFNHQQLLQ